MSKASVHALPEVVRARVSRGHLRAWGVGWLGDGASQWPEQANEHAARDDLMIRNRSYRAHMEHPQGAFKANPRPIRIAVQKWFYAGILATAGIQPKTYAVCLLSIHLACSIIMQRLPRAVSPKGKKPTIYNRLSSLSGMARFLRFGPRRRPWGRFAAFSRLRQGDNTSCLLRLTISRRRSAAVAGWQRLPA